MHRLLRLQHHRHSGKVLAHRHTSYRALAVILVLAGGLIGTAEWCLQKTANADTLYVLATVPAPVPTTAATIDQPTDGTVTTEAITTVSGTCPVITPAVSVVIYSNGVVKGSAPCGASGAFSAQITLVPGSNTLVAKTMTITGDSGPASNSARVTYTPPVAPVEPASPSSGDQTSAPSSVASDSPSAASTSEAEVAPLAINPDQAFLVFGRGKDAVWSGTISGGHPPYTITIDWDDGTVVKYRDIDTATRQFKHRYGDVEAHLVQVSVTDSSGARASASFAAITPYVMPAAGILQGARGSGISPYALFAIYGGYIALLGFVGALWARAHARGYAYARVSRSSVTRRRK